MTLVAPPPRTLTTTDGCSLVARQLVTDATPLGAAVIVHGFSASSECPNVLALGHALHDEGFDVVTYDARGHGGSGGESTLGDREAHDVAAAVAVARERTPRVVLVGASMGGIATLRYAVTDPDLAGAVVVSCPSRWRLPRSARGIAAAAMTRTGVGRSITARMCGVRVTRRWTNPAPPIQLAAQLRIPVAYLHGTRDRFISVRDARELALATPEPRRLVIVPGMGHAFSPEAIGPVREAVRWALAVTPRPAAR
jgi:pimeloyl-ACP methyl ester carboxylesterase